MFAPSLNVGRSLPVALGSSVLMLIAASQSRSQGAPADGLRLIAPTSSNITQLIDTNGQIVHSWQATGLPGLGVYLRDDGDLVRTLRTAGANIAGGTGGGVERYSFGGSLEWSFRYDTNGNRAHHDIAILPNGNVLMIAWESRTAAEARAHGRNPQLMASTGAFRPDHIIEVEEVGPNSSRIVWEWHAWDHVIQDFDATRSNFGVVGNHPELIDLNYPARFAPNGDWMHSNSIEYDPIEDWIILSVRNFGEVWVIDHSTTTQEAAGHTGGNRGRGGDLVYRWGNPAAYDAGTPADQQLFGQHNARVIPPGVPGEGNLTIFNNNAGSPSPSEVFEIVLPARDATGNFTLGANGRYGPTAPIWMISDPIYTSTTQSGAQRLPNGNTLVCTAARASLFEYDPAGRLVWQYQSFGALFHAQFVERSLWTRNREISLASGGSTSFDIVAGSALAGRTYLLLGSASGTVPGFQAGPVRVPLQVDRYLLGGLSSPNNGLVSGAIGTLDADGAARASFSLPGGVLPPAAAGLRLDHAMVVFDAAVNSLVKATNPVPLTIGL